MSRLWIDIFIYTAASLTAAGLAGWWVFFSPLPLMARQGSVQTLLSWKFTLRTAITMGLGTALVGSAAVWNTAESAAPGGPTALGPVAGIVMASGFGLAALGGILAVFSILRANNAVGNAYIRVALRQHPMISLILIISLFGLVFQRGAGAWGQMANFLHIQVNPASMLLLMSAALITVATIGLVIGTNTGRPRSLVKDFIFLVLMGVLLNLLYALSILWWEAPLPDGMSMNGDAGWIYPTVGGALAFFTLYLARLISPWRWAASIISLVFYSLRFIPANLLLISGQQPPHLPLLFFGGALLMDLLPWRWLTPLQRRDLSATGIFAAGYLLLVFTGLDANPNLLTFNSRDIVFTILGTLSLCGLAAPVGRAVKQSLARQRY